MHCHAELRTCVLGYAGAQLSHLFFAASMLCRSVRNDPLPRLKDDLLFYDVIIEGTNERVYEFEVRVDKMKAALRWLIRHNPEWDGADVRWERFDA